MKRARVRTRVRLQAARALEVGGELDRAVDFVRPRGVALLGVRVDGDGAKAGDLVTLELRRRNLERGVVRLGSVLVDVVEIDDGAGILHDSLGPNPGPAKSISFLQFRRSAAPPRRRWSRRRRSRRHVL